MSQIPILLIIVPLAAPPLLFIAAKASRFAITAVAALIATASAGLAIAATAAVRQTGILVYHVGGWTAQQGIVLAVDSLSVIMLALIQLVFLPVLLFPSEQSERVRRLTLLFLLLAALHGVVLTADIFNMYVFIEIGVIVSYALLNQGNAPDRLEGSFKYLLMSSLGSLLVLLAIALVYSASGSLNLAYLARTFPDAPRALRSTVLALLTAGFGLKFGAVPFHAWKPDAYGSAPPALAALASGVVAKVPLYCLVRIVSLLYGFSAPSTAPFLALLAILGSASVVVGHAMALKQERLNRLLSFSSVAHIGYIMIGFATATVVGIEGAVFHMLNHGILKAGLFLVSAAIVAHLQSDEISRMVEISRPMLFPALPFALLALGMIGIPPVVGFVSKWVIVLSGVAGGLLIPGILVALGGFAALWYYQRVTLTFCTLIHDLPFPRLFFSWPERLPALFLTTISVALFAGIPWLHPYMRRAALALMDTGPLVDRILFQAGSL
ncbi:MAG: hypothetical protein EA384_14590 [Spirochaetaceae bacterium]|nr:MAG: hypothetical protein EA384_14590 [Spirochaetaceae bacterium]